MANRQQAQSPQPEPPKKAGLELTDDPPPDFEASNDNRNEGEGNRTADHNYRRGVRRHLKKGNVAKEAEDAKRALEDDGQRKDLEDSEAAARKGQVH